MTIKAIMKLRTERILQLIQEKGAENVWILNGKIVILKSDLGKILREIEDLEIQKRKFKKEEERLRINRDELEKTLNKMNTDRMLLDEEIKGLNKKLKAL